MIKAFLRIAVVLLMTWGINCDVPPPPAPPPSSPPRTGPSGIAGIWSGTYTGTSDGSTAFQEDFVLVIDDKWNGTNWILRGTAGGDLTFGDGNPGEFAGILEPTGDIGLVLGWTPKGAGVVSAFKCLGRTDLQNEIGAQCDYFNCTAVADAKQCTSETLTHGTGVLELKRLAGAPGTSPAFTTVGQYCASLNQAVCGWMTRCGIYSSVGRCLQLGGWTCQLSVKAQASGRAVFDGAIGRRCITDIDTSTCDSAADVFFIGSSNCEKVLTGTVPDGGQCWSDSECGPKSRCDIGKMCPGLCRSRVPLGGAAPTNDDCERGLYLYNGVCAARAKLGASCAAIPPDTYGQWCEGGYCDASNHCKAFASRGQACATSWDCTLGPLFEVCRNGVCGPLCGVGENCRCSFDLVSVNGKCVTGPTVGQSCPDGLCVGNSQCVNTTCQARPAGSTCASKE